MSNPEIPKHQDICRECPTDEELYELIRRKQIELGQLAMLAVERGIGRYE